MMLIRTRAGKRVSSVHNNIMQNTYANLHWPIIEQRLSFRNYRNQH